MCSLLWLPSGRSRWIGDEEQYCSSPRAILLRAVTTIGRYHRPIVVTASISSGDLLFLLDSVVLFLVKWGFLFEWFICSGVVFVMYL